MALDAILEHNRSFARGRAVVPLSPPEAIHLAVLACYDPRLDHLLRPALGLEEGRGFVIRSAGAVVAPDGDPLRSLALAVYLFDVTEILVVGHTSCRMAGFETTRFIEAFRARGVSRAAFGDDDLRAWAGAIPDPRRGVLASVSALRAAPVLPRDLAIGGVVMDDGTGTLDVVISPDEAIPGDVPVTRAASAEAPPARVADGPAPHPPRPAASAPPSPRDAVVAEARALFDALLAHAVWRDEVLGLRSELQTEGNPVARLRAVQRLVRRLTGESREFAKGFDRLRQAGAAARLDDGALVDVVRRVVLGEPQ